MVDEANRAAQDKVRPGLLTLLCVFIFVSSAAGILYVLSMSLPYAQSGILVLYYLIALVIGIGVFNLKKWAYWSFIIFQFLSLVPVLVDIIIVILGIARAEIIPVSEMVRVGFGVAWLLYFSSSSVRIAFGLIESSRNKKLQPTANAPAE